MLLKPNLIPYISPTVTNKLKHPHRNFILDHLWHRINLVYGIETNHQREFFSNWYEIKYEYICDKHKGILKKG